MARFRRAMVFMEGIWEPSDTVTTYENVDGIRWNDDNKWTTKTENASTKAGKFISLAFAPWRESRKYRIKSRKSLCKSRQN